MDITKVATYGVKSTSPKKLEKVANSEKFSLEESAEVIKALTPSEIKLGSIDSLFLNLDSRRKSQRQAVKKGDELLKQLDELRLNIISSSIPKQVLQNISLALKEQVDATIDDKLRNLLLEIETRAAVELAKLER